MNRIPYIILRYAYSTCRDVVDSMYVCIPICIGQAKPGVGIRPRVNPNPNLLFQAEACRAALAEATHSMASDHVTRTSTLAFPVARHFGLTLYTDR